MDRETFRTLVAPDNAEKIHRILQLLASGETLNRFDAERLGDHCLNSTVAVLRNDYGFCAALRDEWERVTCRVGGMTRVKRYRLEDQPGVLAAAFQLLIGWGYQMPSENTPMPPPSDSIGGVE